MVKSMTGFGFGLAEGDDWRAEVTIRSVNQRFLAVRIRSFNDHPQLLSRMESRLKQAFSRGEISIWIAVHHIGGGTDQPLDRQVARGMYTELDAIRQMLAMSDPPTLQDLGRAGGLQPLQAEDEQLWPVLERALEDAVQQADTARSREGTELAREMGSHLTGIRCGLEGILSRLPEVLDEVRARLLEKLETLSVKVDEGRLEAELVLLTDRYDVQEEIVRLQAHLDRAEQALNLGNGPIGKELDFLSQEMLREVNTLGAKARDTSTSSIVVDMKLSIEQFKEQLQNVE